MANIKDINNKNAFKVPENYFDNLSHDIQTKIAEERLKDTFGNKNPFDVPAGYFKNFSVNLIKDKTLVRTIQLLKPYLAIAAGIILVFVIWQVVLTGFDNSQPITETIDEINFDNNLSLADITNFSYIDSEILESQADIYLESYDENTIISLKNKEENSLSVNVDEESVYEYFIDYSDDYNEYAELIAQL